MAITNKPRILITGGAGFIGTNLTRLLLSQGYKLRVFDNFSTGKRENLPASALLEIIEADIRDFAAVKQATIDIDIVIHLAAIASVPASFADPLEGHAVNCIGTLHVLEAMRQYHVNRLIFASSAAVYGNPEQMPIAESAAFDPQSPYAIDKIASEHFINLYRQTYGIKSAIFRFFNVYGPYQDPHSPYSGVISIFSEKLRKGEPVIIYGDGKQTRDFIYVGDLVKILYQSIHDDIFPEHPINLATGIGTSIETLAVTLKSLLKSSQKIEYFEKRTGDVEHSVADIKKLIRYFNPENLHVLKDGLIKLLNFQ